MKVNVFTVLFALFLSYPGWSGIQPVQFENAKWTPNPIENASNSTWLNSFMVDQKAHLLLQFEQMPSTEVKAQLKDIGLTLLDYYPDLTYLVSLDRDVSPMTIQRLGVVGYGSFPVKAKMTRALIQGDIGDWALEGSNLRVVIKYFDGISEEVLRQELSKIDVDVREIHPDYGLINAIVDINRVYDIPQSPVVQFVSAEAEPGQPEDVEGKSLHRSNRINTADPLGPQFDGSGLAVQVRDDGVLGPHIDYHGRLLGNAVGIFGTIEHMDMVAGIFAGAGNVDPDAQGMAPGADVYATNYVDHFLDNTLDLHQTQGVLVTNSSYSNGCNDGYTTITRTVDQQIFQNPSLLHVFSAGNSGTRDCGYGAGNLWGNITGGHKQGKNVIATANLRVDVSLEFSSSRGPSTDGRIKPDLAARGTDQLSTDPNHSYSPGGGTSAASPGVAGVCAQLIHAYKELNKQELPPSSLIKSCLMNTANDLGNVGPDFLYGWGHLNAYRAYKLLEEKRYQTATIAQDENDQYVFNVPDGAEEVRFMLYWRDRPGSLGAGKALVNDLDLTVDFGGDLFFPYVLDPTPAPAALNQPAVEGIDRLNNVEQVRFFQPEAGEYTLDVSGFAIPFEDVEYHVLMEVITQEIDIVYPVGNESFIPGETEQIHWDATPGNMPFRIEFSNDGGATWNFIGQATAMSRTFSWMVPGIATSDAKIRVTRETASDETEGRFFIYPQTSIVQVKRVCPDYIEIEWDGISQAETYNVYLLQDKYMEVVMEVDTPYAQVQVDDVLALHWFSVQAKMADGGLSQRANAIPYQDGVRNCSVSDDVSLDEIINPNPDYIYSCGSYDEAVEVRVTNNGVTKVTSVTVSYDLVGGTSDSETFVVDLDPGESTTLKFTNNLVIPISGPHRLNVSIDAPDDLLPGNNHLSQSFELRNVESTASDVPFEEDFDNTSFPPNGWYVFNEVPISQWERRNVIGITGSRTWVSALNVVASAEIGYRDEFYIHPVDLTNESRAAISFDYACNVETDDFVANLSLVVYSFCENREVTEIFNVDMEFMETVSEDMDSEWEPESRNDWEKIALDLSQFVGSQVVIGFVVENGADFDLYIDNINITNEDLNLPNPDFTISDTLPCQTFTPVEVEASFVSNDYEYQWDFGPRSGPTSAIGPGPHRVRFFEDGINEISLFIRDKTTGAYVIETKYVEVFVRPSPRFEAQVNNLEVQFINESSNADFYEWDFGDGNMSTEENPLHVYGQKGNYKVILKVTNRCTTREDDQNVEVGTVSSTDLLDDELKIYPNPTRDVLVLEKINSQTKGRFSLIDIHGKEFLSGNIGTGKTQSIDLEAVPDGTYLLQTVIDQVSKSYRIVKMK